MGASIAKAILEAVFGGLANNIPGDIFLQGVQFLNFIGDCGGGAVWNGGRMAIEDCRAARCHAPRDGSFYYNEEVVP